MYSKRIPSALKKHLWEIEPQTDDLSHPDHDYREYAIETRSLSFVKLVYSRIKGKTGARSYNHNLWLGYEGDMHNADVYHFQDLCAAVTFGSRRIFWFLHELFFRDENMRSGFVENTVLNPVAD